MAHQPGEAEGAEPFSSRIIFKTLPELPFVWLKRLAVRRRRSRTLCASEQHPAHLRAQPMPAF
jgi:hypothetical protein